MQLEVINTIKHGGKRHEAGAKITVQDADEAKRLIDLGDAKPAKAGPKGEDKGEDKGADT